MAILGGALYPPTNYDGLAYRTPRVLHWLAEGRWHWIHTEFNRLNTRGCGFEWVCAPLIALAKTDRFLFLINAVSFLLLPGLVFSFFRRLGIRERAAWHWMWLVPTGYCFLLQAGSIANDLVGAVFALAALDFALRARESQATRDVWLSILAAGLTAGSKAMNLALLLPWLVALAPSLGLLRRKLAPAFAVSLVAAMVSFLPSAAMNVKYCRDWSGLAAENNDFLRGKPMLRLANNAVILPMENLVPPVFPLANKWNQGIKRLVPERWQTELEKAFEPSAAHWELGEMEIEESSGLGLGVSGLLLLSAAAGWFYAARRRRAAATSAPPQQYPPKFENAPLPFRRWGIVLSALVALLVFLAKSGLSTPARLVAAFYPLCIPAFLMAPSQAQIVRQAWWRRAALAVFVLAAVPVILSPARPLWPANTVLANADSAASPLLARAKLVYAVQGQRFDGFAPLRQRLPPGLQRLGMITFDDPETSLWRPFGQRRIEHVTRSDSAADLRAKGIECVVVNSREFDRLFQRPFDEWLKEMNGELMVKLTLPLRASRGPSDWFLVKLRSELKP